MVGSWKITTPPGSGKFEAKIVLLTSSASVGIITGRFRDDPTSSLVGQFGGIWEICP